MSRALKKNDAVRNLELDGRILPVWFRRNARAKRVIIRLDLENDGVRVTLPRGAGPEEGFELIRRKSSWVFENLDALAPRVPFADGAAVPLLGQDHIIRFNPGRGRPVSVLDGVITVTGRAEHVTRRVRDWLKDRARDEITPRVAAKAALLGLNPRKIQLRDTRSRWGSYSTDGGFSFCWRLVMTPEFVLDYVVAHEVAHMKVMDHSDRFWAQVAELTGDVKKACSWLKRHGDRLHRYG